VNPASRLHNAASFMIFEARAFVLTGLDQRIGDRPVLDHIMLMTDLRPANTAGRHYAWQGRPV